VFDFTDLDADTMYSDYSSDITKKMVSLTCQYNCVIQVYWGEGCLQLVTSNR
jgi:hypothetical protein